MLDVTVKTLDGQNKTFSIPEETTVVQFKEKIAGSINIPADTQRLIFHGRVLQDEKLLKEYDVDGKVIHVVQRPPPSSLSSTTNPESSGSPHAHPHHHHHHLPPNVQSVVVGSFTIPPNLLNSPQHIPMNGSSVNVHINLSPAEAGTTSNSTSTSNVPPASTTDTSAGSAPATSAGSVGGRGVSNSMTEAAQRLAQARRNFRLAQNTIDRLQNPRNRTDDTSVDTGPSSETSEHTATTASSTSSTTPTPAGPASTSQSGSPQASPRETDPRELARILREAERLHSDLSPFISQLCQLADRDPVTDGQNLREQQMLVDQVSEALHALSHGYHNISDIAYELSSAPPRQLMAQPLPIYQQPHGPSVVVHGHPHPAPPRPPRRNNTNQSSSTTPTTTQNNAAANTATTTTPTTPLTSASTTAAASPPPSSTQPASAHTHSHSFSHSFSSSSSGGESVSVGGEGAGTEENPYVFFEMGPDSLTVNSISTTVVVSEEMDEDMEADVAAPQGLDSSTSSSARTRTVASSASSNPQTATSSATTSQPSVGQPLNFQGISSIPGVPADLMNSIVQSVLQAHGVRQGDQVQVNVVPVQVPGGGPGMVGVQANEAFVLSSANSVPAASSPSDSNSRGENITNITSTGTTSSPTASTTPASTSAARTTSTAAPTSEAAAASTGGAPSQRPTPPPPAPGFSPRAPGANNARIPIFRQRAPMFPPPRNMLPMPLMQPTDIYLPCFSHHFISQAVRERLDQRMQGTQNLGNMMAGMMSTLFGQPRPRGPPMSERSSQQPGGTPQRNASDTTNRAQTSTTATQQGSISANPFATLFSQILGGAGPLGQMAAANTAAASANASSDGETGEDSAQGGNAEGMSDAFFARLVQGVRSQASQAMSGNQSSQTVAAFLQTMGDNHSILPGEGFVMDAFLCVAEQLTFSDMITIFMGQHQPIAQLRRPMRQFVSERVLNGSAATDENLQRGTDTVVEEFLPDVMTMVSGAAVVDNVDLRATLRKFFVHHLLTLFKLIVNYNVSDEQFALQFYNGFRRTLGEFVILMPACLQDGQPAFNAMIENRLTGQLTGLNPMLQQWMTSMTLQHVASFQQIQSISQSDVEGYMERHPTAPAAPRVVAAAASPQAGMGEGERKTEGRSGASASRESPMEVDSPPHPTPTLPSAPAAVARSLASQSAQVPRTLDLRRLGERMETRSRTQEGRIVNGNLGSAASTPAATITSPGSVQDNWQEVVPSEWVPVMEADVQRQKTQRSQGPFSDAYLQGMPPKRRRLMSYEQAGNLSNMSDYLPAAVKQAAGRAGVEPVSSSDNLVAEATDAQELQGMLEAEVMRSLSDRLEQDDDYSAERFPNAQQYFKPKPS